MAFVRVVNTLGKWHCDVPANSNMGYRHHGDDHHQCLEDCIIITQVSD